MLTMFYHYQFRTKKSLEVSLDWLKSSSSYPSRALRSKMLHYTARDLVDSRREFCKLTKMTPQAFEVPFG